MRTSAPRDAVKRVVRESSASAGASSSTPVDDDSDASAGTRARRAAQADKVVEKSTRKSRRVTAKGTGTGTGANASNRYTPPTPHYSEMPSPLWVPILMFALFGLGMLTIIMNDVDLVPGGTNNWYLLLGLGFILGGIITATQYR